MTGALDLCVVCPACQCMGHHPFNVHPFVPRTERVLAEPFGTGGHTGEFRDRWSR